MPRPTSKTALLAISQENYLKLIRFIERLPPEFQRAEFPPGTLNRNIRDVLAHLHHWHLLMLDWYRVGMAGQKPQMPAEGYSWKTTPALNRFIWEKYQETSLPDIKIQLQDSYESVQELIQKHPAGDMFEKKQYPWTGSTSLGAYLISATSSHYAWALKLIRKAQK